MNKRQILDEIKRLATAQGKAPGRTRFESETGIRTADWYPHHWLRWGDALREAGFSPNKLVVALDNNVVLEKYIAYARELGRLPIEGELRLKPKSDPTFPSHSVFARFGGRAGLLAAIREHCQTHPDFADVLPFLPAAGTRSGQSAPNGRALIQGYVYMLRSGRRYKIGHTNSPARRHREVRLDLPDPTNLVHSIETDDPRGIEAYWHRRFESKRVRDTEFFTLDASDVAAFKRRKYQ